jgi:hypothetical protein
MRSLICDDQDTLDERLRVPVLAEAETTWLGMGTGLACAENTSSSGSSVMSPDVATTVRASCAPSAPVRLGRRAPRAEHGDLVHGAFASRHAGGGGGDRDGRGGLLRDMAQARVLRFELGDGAGLRGAVSGRSALRRRATSTWPSSRIPRYGAGAT